MAGLELGLFEWYVAVAAYHIDLPSGPDDGSAMRADVLDAAILAGAAPAFDGRSRFAVLLIGLCSKNPVNATSVTKSEISRFRSRRPLPPDPYCSAPTQPPPLAAAWPWQVIGKNAKLNRRRDTFVSEISEFRHRRRD